MLNCALAAVNCSLNLLEGTRDALIAHGATSASSVPSSTSEAYGGSSYGSGSGGASVGIELGDAKRVLVDNCLRLRRLKILYDMDDAQRQIEYELRQRLATCLNTNAA